MPVVRLPVRGRGVIDLAPSKIVCLGLNYLEHIRESGQVRVRNFTGEIPEEPVLFNKTPNVLVGPGAPIVLPAFLADYGFRELRTDHEAELAIVMARRAKHLDEEEVREHVLGFTCFNDVSQRNLQRMDKAGWWRGKSLDTFGPIGPEIVPWDALGDPQRLDILCRVNGRIVQAGNTAQMLFSIPQLVAFVSRNLTLEPGDVIATGTPAGVGPIRAGDIVEVEIEGIGVLRNPVEEEPRVQ